MTMNGLMELNQNEMEMVEGGDHLPSFMIVYHSAADGYTAAVYTAIGALAGAVTGGGALGAVVWGLAGGGGYTADKLIHGDATAIFRG